MVHTNGSFIIRENRFVLKILLRKVDFLAKLTEIMRKMFVAGAFEWNLRSLKMVLQAE